MSIFVHACNSNYPSNIKLVDATKDITNKHLTQIRNKVADVLNTLSANSIHASSNVIVRHDSSRNHFDIIVPLEFLSPQDYEALSNVTKSLSVYTTCAASMPFPEKIFKDLHIEATAASDKMLNPVYFFVENTYKNIFEQSVSSTSKVTLDSITKELKIDDTAAKRLLTLINAASNQKSIERVLDFANNVLMGFGVEGISDYKAWDKVFLDVVLLYVNLGDPQVNTLLYDVKKSEFLIGNWLNWSN